MTQLASEPGPLAYATGVRAAVSARAWRVLLWVGIAHLAAVLVLLAASVPAQVQLAGFFRNEPTFDWFVMGMLAEVVSVHVMMLGNALAVAGYWAGSRGRSPRRWFLIYVPTQLSLMLLLWLIVVVLAAASPHALSPSSSVGVSYVPAVVLPFAYVVLNLPLSLLLIRNIRRACFAA